VGDERGRSLRKLRWIGRRARHAALGRPGSAASASPAAGGGDGDPGPGAHAAAPATVPETDPRTRGLERRAAVRRATYLALTLLALALTARAIGGERGLLDARRSVAELDRAQAEVQKWRDRNTWLEARIEALKDDPATIESLARERLDYVKPGEITFLFPTAPAAPSPGEPAAAAPGEFSPVLP